jgi:glycosyltransferase involved in cell wall biosynthesis
MKLLILSQYYAPEQAYVNNLARGLHARGHTVRVLTGFPNYPSGKIAPGYRVRPWQREMMDGVEVCRVPLIPDHSLSLRGRLANYGSFAIAASTIGQAFAGGFEVMYAYHPPLTVGIPAVILSRMHRMPVLYGVMDLWPESILAAGVTLRPSVHRALRALENWVYQRVERIAVLSPGFKRNLVGKGVPGDKVDFVPLLADADHYRPLPRDEAFGAEYGLAGRINIIYGGNLGGAQRLDDVLRAAALLRELPAVQFVFVGDGVAEESLRALAQELALPNVRFLGRHPIEDMPQFYAWGDALLVYLKDDPLFRITIPSKTIAYLACGRPILMGMEGDAAEIVREGQAGLVCPPGDPAALAAAVRELAAMPLAQREAMGLAGRRLHEQRFASEIIVSQYEALLEQLIRERKDKRRP